MTPELNDPSLLMWETTLGAAQLNTLRRTQMDVETGNAQLARLYLSRFSDWTISVRNGAIPNTNPPVPPVGWVVGPPDSYGFQWPVVGSDPVAVMPPIPDGPPALVIRKARVPKVDVPKGDTHKPGETVTGAYLIAMGSSTDDIGDPSAIWTRREFGGMFGAYEYYSAPGEV